VTLVANRIGRRAVLLSAASLLSCRRGSELPRLGKLEAFSLTDQDGRKVGTAELRDGVWVAAFMFTRCPTICPRITRRMRELQLEAKEQGVKITLVSFSVDPEYDTPAVLKEYAARYSADLSSWRFLTGDLEVVKKTAVGGFKQALEGRADPQADGFGILHGSHLALVDRELELRGFYATDVPAEGSRLLVDAKALG
jgi:protein SCO1/2